ncbi:MAG TPA: SRPBCC family protein [Bdellovibrio sp.]|uniref:SRPBCC family protein n=1 Tax=Bdellovibrio sp. TaxID=28201 RepID=UPI002F005934
MPKSKDTPINPELDLVLEKIVPLTRQEMFKAWTTASTMKDWFCPRPWKTTEVRLGLYPGGEFYANMQSPEGQNFPNSGCVLEVVENERLVWTDSLTEGFRPSANSFMTAILTFEDHPQGTKYTARACHKSAEDRKRHEEMGFLQGWSTVVDQLIASVKKK